MNERNFSDVMQEALAGLASGLKSAGSEIGTEMSRLGTQGASELASALFGNGAYVMYGPGQRPPTQEVDKGSQDQDVQAEPQREHGGLEL